MGKNIVKTLLKESLHIESLLTELNDELDFSAFKMNDTLQPDIWDSEDRIKPEIRKTLLKIAEDYWDSLDLDFDYLDITMTGSLSNFNWSKYSDVDLHIIFDINELGDKKEMVKDLLDVKTRKWNSDHNITIKGFEVELYLQPEDQPHHSTGVYSLMDDEWVIEPKKQGVKLDKETIRKKYKDIVKTIEDIEKDKDNNSVVDRVEKFRDKISKMRQAGLDEGGEFSVENIVFKLLRRNDIMDKLGDLSSNAYDDEHTIDEDILNEGLKDWILAGSLAFAALAPNTSLAQSYNNADDKGKEKILNTIQSKADKGVKGAINFMNTMKNKVGSDSESVQEKPILDTMQELADSVGGVLGVGTSPDLGSSRDQALFDAKTKLNNDDVYSKAQGPGKVYKEEITKDSDGNYVTYIIYKANTELDEDYKLF